MLSTCILNALILQKKYKNIVTNNVFWDQKQNKTQEQQNKKIKHKNPCRSQELNPGPLAPNADALPLHHRVN